MTRIRCGRPASIPASSAAPTSSTCTCTFQVGSPPTTTSESPSAASVSRSVGIASAGASSRYITSYVGPCASGSSTSRPLRGQAWPRLVGAVPGQPDLRRRRLGTGHDRGQRVQQHADAAAAGVDDTGPPQHLELLGCPGQRGPGAGGRRGDHGRERVGVVPAGRRAAGSAVSAATRATVSMVPSTGSATAA